MTSTNKQGNGCFKSMQSLDLATWRLLCDLGGNFEARTEASLKWAEDTTGDEGTVYAKNKNLVPEVSV